MKIRVKFQKKGSLKFIGHLDVMRTFQKLNRRAGIDIKYSEGFSPHQEMSFATPLGLGLTSDAEYVDFVMNSLPDRVTFIETLNRVNVPEMQIMDACLLPDDSKSAMSLLAAGDYTLTPREDHVKEPLDAFYEALFDWLKQESIPVEKETKTRTVTVDLKQQIRIAERRGDSLFFRVDTGSASNLKPEFVVESFCKATGREYDPFLFQVNRDELYGEVDGELKSLLDYGQDFLFFLTRIRKFSILTEYAAQWGYKRRKTTETGE